MRPSIGRGVAAHDMSVRVDFVRIRFDRAGGINRRELAVAQQKPVSIIRFPCRRRAGGGEQTVESHDVAAAIDSDRFGGQGAVEIDRSEFTSLRSKVSMKLPHHTRIPPDDVAAPVDPVRMGAETAWEINPCELSIPASQKAVAVTVGSAVVRSDNFASIVNIEGIRDGSIAVGRLNRDEGPMKWVVSQSRRADEDREAEHE